MIDVSRVKVKLPYTIEDFDTVPEAMVWVCKNCGAFGHHTDFIEHCEGCKPGEYKEYEQAMEG